MTTFDDDETISVDELMTWLKVNGMIENKIYRMAGGNALVMWIMDPIYRGRAIDEIQIELKNGEKP